MYKAMSTAIGTLATEASYMQLDDITVDRGRMNGQPCVRHTRLTVRRLLEALTLYPEGDELIQE